MIPEQIIERTLHDNICSFENLFHGWIIIVNDKVWMNDNGVFLFDDRAKAMQAFYNCMKWKFRNQIYQYNRSNGTTLEENRFYWDSFKRAIGFSIKHI